MRVVVTGAAGFIGSHVAEAMSEAGCDVLAVDALARSTYRAAAVRNWARLARHRGITPASADLATDDLRSLAEAELIVHLAGRPGVRTSWDNGGAAVQRDNVRATRRLLAACAARPAGQRPRVVVASSSSVYGSAADPCDEAAPLRPESPYAAAKVAVERLSAATRAQVHTVILRFFSVYGPRQRPDMAFHRFIEAALGGGSALVFGDGTQSRAFTYIADVVRATVLAATAALPPATVVNVGHPTTVPLGSAIARIQELLGGRPLPVTYAAAARGDVDRTWAATSAPPSCSAGPPPPASTRASPSRSPGTRSAAGSAAVRDRHRAAYVAFDRFPSTKGSAVHIQHAAGELFGRYGGGLLCVLGGGELPRYQRENGVEIVRFDAVVPNLLDRARAFSGWVSDQIAPYLDTLELCQVRDPWSALPVIAGLAGAPGRCRLVYEVNGLPSIELPHAWPLAAPSTLTKIREIERFCLRHADAVVVQSAVIAAAVTALGAAPDAVHVVPNGADVPVTRPPRPADAPAGT